MLYHRKHLLRHQILFNRIKVSLKQIYAFLRGASLRFPNSFFFRMFSIPPIKNQFINRKFLFLTSYSFSKNLFKTWTAIKLHFWEVLYIKKLFLQIFDSKTKLKFAFGGGITTLCQFFLSYCMNLLYKYILIY